MTRLATGGPARLAAAGLALLVALAPAAGAHEGGEAFEPALRFRLPEAGSYELPVIDRVGEHELLAPDGERAPLLGLAPGQLALVSFVYLSCTDASGCPLSLATLQRADRALAARPELAGRVRLVTVSFDPGRDGPEQMAGLRHHMSPKGDWRFLTAPDDAALVPVLADYGQDAVPVLTADGSRTGLMQHVVKVFLVDGQGGIRNVYSTGTLDHRLLVLDVETLLRAE
jgi:cytochrome c peroxidase